MARRNRQTQIVWGHKTPNVEQKLEDIVPWVLEAGRPYYDVFLDGTDPEEVVARWLQRRSSEIALRRTRLAVVDDRIAGGYVSLAGSEVAGCRQADLLDLARTMSDHSYSELRARMDDLSDLFAPVEAHDFVLSKLGTLDRVDDDQVEYDLIDDFVERAQYGGFVRARVDVDEDDEQRRAMYENYGFRAVYRGKSKESGLRYLSMVVEL